MLSANYFPDEFGDCRNWDLLPLNDQDFELALSQNNHGPVAVLDDDLGPSR